VHAGSSPVAPTISACVMLTLHAREINGCKHWNHYGGYGTSEIMGKETPCQRRNLLLENKMSYHDGYDPRRAGNKSSSKENYYDELNFWITKCKNLQALLSDARDHIFDYEMLLSEFVKSLEGHEFDEEHHEDVQRFLRILEQEMGERK